MEQPVNQLELETFTEAFLNAVNSDVFGGYPTPTAAFALSTLVAINDECSKFYFAKKDLIANDFAFANDFALAGYLFFHTRNGSGTFFSDVDFPNHGAELLEYSQTFGEFEAYQGDDELIYAVGYENYPIQVKA